MENRYVAASREFECSALFPGDLSCISSPSFFFIVLRRSSSDSGRYDCHKLNSGQVARLRSCTVSSFATSGADSGIGQTCDAVKPCGPHSYLGGIFTLCSYYARTLAYCVTRWECILAPLGDSSLEMIHVWFPSRVTFSLSSQSQPRSHARHLTPRRLHLLRCGKERRLHRERTVQLHAVESEPALALFSRLCCEKAHHAVARLAAVTLRAAPELVRPRVPQRRAIRLPLDPRDAARVKRYRDKLVDHRGEDREQHCEDNVEAAGRSVLREAEAEVRLESFPMFLSRGWRRRGRWRGCRRGTGRGRSW